MKYAVEAERRAFGENITYASVRVSPCPHEGSSADLTREQKSLLELAMQFSRSYQSMNREFKYFSWVMDNEGVVRRTSSAPSEDTHPVLQPVQRSLGRKRLKELGQTGQMRACVLMQIVGPLGDGIVSYELEQRGQPRVSARQLFWRQADGSYRYNDMRFHLEDPQFFSGPLQ